MTTTAVLDKDDVMISVAMTPKLSQQPNDIIAIIETDLGHYKL